MHRLTVVDAFTSRPFAGNPAAVCLLSAPADEQWMRNIAAEMNLAETAFLLPEKDGYRLRWLTPESEVDLCGHATLASSHFLWSDGHQPAGSELRFYTRSGLLTARQKDGMIWLDFPAKPAVEAADPGGLVAALGTRPVWIGRNKFDFLCELDDEAAVRSLAPNQAALAAVEARGIMVTSRAQAGAEYDFVSRFFAPREGIPEDPVTGSAHSALAPYWAAKLGRTTLTGYQASRRGGLVRTVVQGDRVQLGGQAVIVSRVEFV
jgi:predicted PhzF superfamily epimerase YddE/YHI9